MFAISISHEGFAAIETALPALDFRRILETLGWRRELSVDQSRRATRPIWLMSASTHCRSFSSSGGGCSHHDPMDERASEKVAQKLRIRRASQ
jgi:hypothetical protein